MPIKPENRKLYPKSWPRIRSEILARARNRCERCAAPNHALGAQDKGGRWHYAFAMKRLDPATLKELFGARKPVKVVLTTAHLNHNPKDNRRANLKALCQRCHNTHDAKHRAKTRASR